jgi:HAMP domain-containing protein
MSEKNQPKFDKDIELLKISLVSEEIRTAYYNFNAICFSFMIPVAIVEIGFGSQIGIAVYVGLLSVLFILAGLAIVSTKRYLRRFSRLQPLIHNVENGKMNGSLDEILEVMRDQLTPASSWLG